MVLFYELYLPTMEKNVKIEVSIPNHYDELGVEFDTLYVLDGQNAFKDNRASFGRSIRMGKYLAIMASKFDKRICGVAIYNAESDMGRINEYTPFPLESEAQYIWPDQDVDICEKYTYDFIHTIIPFIQNKFPVSKKPENTFIMGSSLGALYASYLAITYPDVFGVAGLFSNCPFLCENAYYYHMENHIENAKNVRIFNYVGLHESSDGEFDPNRYSNAAEKFFEFVKSHGLDSRLVIDIFGIHSEACWEKHILQFFSYIYFDDFYIC